LNKKRFVIGVMLIMLGLALALPELVQRYGESSPVGPVRVVSYVIVILSACLALAGLALSVGELAKSVVKRLRESRERNRANRDRQRQARRNTPGSASQ
jgi:CDP-diglyceride synthetase